MQYFALSFGLCLVCSALGFWRTAYFVTLGYAASIAVQAVAAAILYRGSIGGWPLVQVLLLCAYGIRLGSYLALRGLDRGYQDRDSPHATGPAKVGLARKPAIWIGVSAIYVLMALPASVTLAAQARGFPPGSLHAGIALMAIGLAVESAADWQKYRFKAAHPTRFCNTGLYRVVRCPNYLGEMLFWSGSWLTAAATYQGWLEWVLCSLGLASILGIMIGATRRLEAEQAAHYVQDPAFASYRSSVPVLFPLLPLYSLRGTAASHP